MSAARSRKDRTASELAFVVLGGLVPELLCADSGRRHAGTTDVDVQLDLEVACGAVNTARLENALRNPEFEPDASRVWRWVTDGVDGKTVVKFELLADLDGHPQGVAHQRTRTTSLRNNAILTPQRERSCNPNVPGSTTRGHPNVIDFVTDHR